MQRTVASVIRSRTCTSMAPRRGSILSNESGDIKSIEPIQINNDVSHRPIENEQWEPVIQMLYEARETIVFHADNPAWRTNSYRYELCWNVTIVSSRQSWHDRYVVKEGILIVLD